MKALKGKLPRILDLPYFAVIALTVGLYVVKEWYPFSHFPMYSRLENEATLVFLTDEDGDPLAFRNLFGVAASEAKKQFNSRLGKLTGKEGRGFFEATEAEEAEAGREVLGYLLNRRDEAAFAALEVDRVRLFERRIHLEGGEVRREDRLLAEVEAP